MHARVVRFTDVTPERISQIVAAVEESGGPPPGVDSAIIRLLVRREPAVPVRDEALFFQIVRAAFQQRRKMQE